MNNPGGDQYDGTVSLPMCPHCPKLFFSYEEMVSHIARHEGGTRKDKNTALLRTEHIEHMKTLKNLLRSKV